MRLRPLKYYYGRFRFIQFASKIFTSRFTSHFPLKVTKLSSFEYYFRALKLTTSTSHTLIILLMPATTMKLYRFLDGNSRLFDPFLRNHKKAGDNRIKHLTYCASPSCRVFLIWSEERRKILKSNFKSIIQKSPLGSFRLKENSDDVIAAGEFFFPSRYWWRRRFHGISGQQSQIAQLTKINFVEWKLRRTLQYSSADFFFQFNCKTSR